MGSLDPTLRNIVNDTVRVCENLFAGSVMRREREREREREPARTAERERALGQERAKDSGVAGQRVSLCSAVRL